MAIHAHRDLVFPASRRTQINWWFIAGQIANAVMWTVIVAIAIGVWTI